MAETTKPTPNKKLRHERERRCWSQQELADLLGTTPLNVGRWERGVTLPGPHFRQKLCEVFEKSPDELGLILKETDTEQTPEALPEVPVVSAPFSAQTPPTTLWNVPHRRNIFFTGREDILTHLHDTLILEEHPVAITQPQAISGLGGIGKTQTAIEYAYRYRDSYDAVLWVRADSHDLLVSDFLTIAALINLPERNEQDQSKIVAAVKRWFDTHEGWLLILDNADDLQVVEEFIPSTSKGHILLTTRAYSTGTIAQRIELDKMELDEGTSFLLHRTKRLKGPTSLDTVPVSVREQAQTIVEAVDSLPLALDQAGAYIEETGCSFADYIKLYKTRRNRLLRTRGRDASGHPEPVAATWSLSFEKVERANPAAAELLRLCAFLHPDAISESMIVEGASELGPVLQPVAQDELELNEAIGELHKYSLVKRDSELKILNIHRLVQAVLTDAMDKETQGEWVERTVRMVNHVFPEVEFATWPRCQQYLPHAQVCVELIEQRHLKLPEATHLLNHTGLYLLERGQYTESEAFLQLALAIREQELGPTHLNVAEILNNLGHLSWRKGKYAEAELLFERALAIRERILEPTDLILARSLGNLGTLYMHQGKYEQAEPFMKRVLTIFEEVQGPTHPQVAVALNNLAALYGTQGKYEQAEALFQRALSLREMTLEPTHPNLARSLYNLAKVYYDQGKYEQAEPLYQRSLAIREQVLETGHPDIAQGLSGLAVLYRVQKRFEEARVLFQRALTIQEQALGANHPELADMLDELALLYIDQGHYSEALQLYQRALPIKEQSLGSTHPSVATTLERYANLLRKTNRETEAVPLESRAQAIRAKNAH